MTAQGNVTPISERVRLVIALTQINSDHLRSESRLAGAEIELEGALAASSPETRTSQQWLDIELLREQLRDASEALRVLEAERARLMAALAEVEAAARRDAR
jgi:hypothetical protein